MEKQKDFQKIKIKENNGKTEGFSTFRGTWIISDSTENTITTYCYIHMTLRGQKRNEQTA